VRSTPTSQAGAGYLHPSREQTLAHRVQDILEPVGELTAVCAGISPDDRPVPGNSRQR
jgi:hypothetical protein